METTIAHLIPAAYTYIHTYIQCMQQNITLIWVQLQNDERIGMVDESYIRLDITVNISLLIFTILYCLQQIFKRNLKRFRGKVKY